MPFQIVKEFSFSAAHFLTQYHGKCENLHGHNYRLVVIVRGAVQADGMVMDFHELEDIVNDHVLTVLDHTNLNDRFANPTCELVAQWIWQTLQPRLVHLYSVQLFETDHSSVIYAQP